MPIDIIPSILVSSEEVFQRQMTDIAGTVPLVQIDLADGQFVPNTTWPWQHPTQAQTHITADFELHLMVQDPLRTIESWHHHPHLKRFMIHYESVTNISQILTAVARHAKKLYLVLNPDTPITVLKDCMHAVDGVMLMGVYPGRQGQQFIPKTLNRIREIKNQYPTCIVEVDGGVNEETIVSIAQAGADAVCPGNAIFGNTRTPKENIVRLRLLTEKASV